MANCPICDRVLPDDFGLIECGQCGAALFVEFDGSVRRRDESGQGKPPVVEPPNVMGMEAQSSERSGLSTLKLPEKPMPVDLGNLDQISPVLPGADVIEEIQQQPAPPVKQAPEAASAGFGMKEIADFGNSEESAGREGTFSYDISISGIDSADLRTAIKEALTDPLFLWDTEALIREAKQGELKIANITAVKAAIVVQRLRGLPVDIQWVQHGLFES
jgi:hypothetical protein